MCRYHNIRMNTAYTYKCTYVCTHCRNSKQAWHEDEQRCVTCNRQMNDVGLDLRLPRKIQVRKWKKLKGLVDSGRDLHSCGCDGPGKIDIG